MHSYQPRDHDDGDNFSMQHMICFIMIQQQQTRDEHCADRQPMIQTMTMTMIHVNGVTQNDAINEKLNAMMANLANQAKTTEQG